ncbi:hypothetical protein [Hyphomicrobium sp.]|uniref:hypothetical protein n=1 Tax=Hyphomicrobium sp. TaxID=82 RepID=UPI001DD0D586|nr:hypothetical protein [Hyphomicrobium sp.]MBY0558668.1 hypothetical protein [Hyphomicrobium sp.]
MSAAANRDERLQIMLEPEELRAVDDFRYKYRLPSRAAAVRELLKRGLTSAPTGTVDDHSRSQDFGVLRIANGSRFKDADSTDGK